MGTLTITKAYAALNPLLEAHIDNFRTGLLTLFNTDKFSSANFSGSLTFTSTKFSTNELTTTDNSNLTFGTDDDGTIGLDSSAHLVFNTTTSNCTITFTAGSKNTVMKTTQIDVPGDIVIGAGGSGYGVLFLLGKYRKPVLVYSTSTVINLEQNSGTTDQTVLALPKYVIAVTETIDANSKYRSASISNTANGYDSDDTGAARGGKRQGLTLTTNSWYAVYGTRVRYGSDAGNKFIMVIDDTLPTQANWSTLDTRYGTEEWVYLGLIRYGYGANQTDSAIIPFVYTNKGWCYFTGNGGTSYNGGLVLAQSTADANDSPLYTVADSMSGQSIPCDAISQGIFNLRRAAVSNWFIRDSSDVIIWRGGWQAASTSEKHGHSVQMQVQSGMDFCQTRVGTGAQDKRVVLNGFCDRFINVRRHGYGT
jgi:hypothetical protein